MSTCSPCHVPGKAPPMLDAMPLIAALRARLPAAAVACLFAGFCAQGCFIAADDGGGSDTETRSGLVIDTDGNAAPGTEGKLIPAGFIRCDGKNSATLEDVPATLLRM